MKKIKFLSFITVMLIILIVSTNPVKANAPYYTFTADSNGRLIKTIEAYTPSKQLYQINGERFVQPEHIFIDSQNYTYITDSKAPTKKDFIDPETGEVKLNPITNTPLQRRFVGKVYVLDENLNYVAELYHEDILFPKNTFVTEEYIYVVDFKTSNILIFDKEKLLTENEVVLVKTITPPIHPIFQDQVDKEGKKTTGGYSYKPEHIAVDSRGNIYVQGIGSKNGLIMLDNEGEFMTFFGGNPLRVPIVDQIRSLFLTETQEKKMQESKEDKIFYDIPSNITIDQKGYVYTVTSSLGSNPIKKFNVSGTNYFKKHMIGTKDMNSIWVGQYNNLFSINESGYIFEYDSNGNLLFLFGGKDYSSNRAGLLISPVSIASNKSDEVLVLDQANLLIQIYQPTEFTDSIHSALEAYQDGDYEESGEKWKYILQYNALFDYAHIGLGNAYMRDDNYQKAFEEYFYANNYQGISDAYWGVRQGWMTDNLQYVFLSLVLLFVLRITYFFVNRKIDLTSKIKHRIKQIRNKSRTIDELFYIPRFLKHPLDSFYEIKRENRVSFMTSTIIYLLLLILYILNYKYTNIIFVEKVGVNVSYELFVIVLVGLLWVISNYLVCAISDGEGSIKNVYNATAYTLTPILIIMPFIILFSNVLTLQEKVFYDFGYLVMTLWTAFLFFFMIKDIHNYNVKQTFGIILKSIFTMLIIGLFLFVINALASQMYTVVKEIIMEVINR